MDNLFLPKLVWDCAHVMMCDTCVILIVARFIDWRWKMNDKDIIISELILDFKKKYLNKRYFLNNKIKIIKIGVLLCVLIVSLGILMLGHPKDEKIKITSNENVDSELKQEQVQEMIIVDIGGEVVNPQVVQLKVDSRVEDAIIKAGGLTENADISTINRAAILIDGEKVYVPSKNTAENVGADTLYEGQIPEGEIYSPKVNINTANATMLQEINGVGPATALKIIEHRTENGRFSKIEDIMEVTGIGEKTFEEMKDDITI